MKEPRSCLLTTTPSTGTEKEVRFIVEEVLTLKSPFLSGWIKTAKKSRIESEDSTPILEQERRMSVVELISFMT
jgi:hypothetical protein